MYSVLILNNVTEILKDKAYKNMLIITTLSIKTCEDLNF